MNVRRTLRKLLSRRRMACLLLALAGVMAALLIAEGALAIMNPEALRPHPPGMYTLDRDVGYVLTPSFEGHFKRAEFNTHITVGELGLRGGDPSPRGHNALRILCLGDSFTFGYGVAEEETWPVLLQHRLASRYPNCDIDVLNAGVPGYGTDEELEFLKSRGNLLDPDLVIVQFFAGNDFVDNRSPARATHKLQDGILYIVDGRGAQSQPLWLRANNWLKTRSHVVSVVSEHLGYLTMRAGLLAALEKPSSEHFTEAEAAVATELLVKIASVADGLGARTLFLFVPEKMQVLSGGEARVRAAGVVETAAAASSAPWVDLTSIFKKRDDRFDLFFGGDAHWTPLGNRVAAEVLAQRIVDLGLVQVATADRNSEGRGNASRRGSAAYVPRGPEQDGSR